MKHLKKFENSQEKIFTLDEIADIINEFADSFEVEEQDIEIFYYDGISDQLISLNELRDKLRGNPSFLEQIEDLLEINIPRSEKEYDDFFQEYDDNIKIWKELKSLNGKLETLGCYIVPNTFEKIGHSEYSVSIRKIR
jgi:hypothetical protein